MQVNLERPLFATEETLNELTLPSFMIEYVYDHISDHNEVLKEVGLPPETLKGSQLGCLIELPLIFVFGCLKQFVKWVAEGFYDFSSLPIAVKTHMAEKDAQFIEQGLWGKWTGSHGDLVAEVKQLTEVLKHCEVDITKKVNEESSAVSVLSAKAMY